MYWVLFIGIALLSWIVQNNLNRKFKKYSSYPAPMGMTGAQAARRMLEDNGVDGVRITCIEGRLTDHYNPTDNTVNLSHDVYHGNSMTSVAVACHECGHAVQHAAQYAPVKMRSALVPVVQFSSSIVSWVLLAGIFLINVFPAVMLVGIVLFALTTLFSFVTLPVEIDASHRALLWMKDTGIATTSSEIEPARESLKAAAYTYVVAALSSLATLVYYVMIFLSRRD